MPPITNNLSADHSDLELRFKSQYIDLVSERIGGKALSCSDDFFAPMENLLKAGRGIFIDDKYTDRGKWMDGWESRRSYGRDNGRDFDWCLMSLGIHGFIRGFDIDSNHFRGNAPQAVSVEACSCEQLPDENTCWQTILKQSPITAHSQNLFEISSDTRWTHVRLNIFPDGGIARFRVYGEADIHWDDFDCKESIDLASIKNGAKVLQVSDMFFSDKNNLIMPGHGKNMGDGWETKRRRSPGNDWSIVKLADKGNIEAVIIDTRHFKGNFPDSFMLEGCVTDNDDFSEQDPQRAQVAWCPIIPQTKLQPDHEHHFNTEILVDPSQHFTHIRLSIFPDGGISRMRIFGHRKSWSLSRP